MTALVERTLLFADLIDSTALVERLGDLRSTELFASHDRRSRELLERHRGQEIDRSDGFFVLFPDVAEAVRFALDYHELLEHLELRARVGIHVGPVALSENSPDDVRRGARRIDVGGLAKPFTARLMSLAGGRQTLLSADAQRALRPGLAGVECRSHGHYRLKGIEEPAEIFEVGTSASSFSPPVDAEKAYRVVRVGDLWSPIRAVRHNLPPERDAFVGRVGELRRLAGQLKAHQLVTVLGTGGTGKTRLVVHYCRAWLGEWPGGVYFCDLSDARSADGICFAVAGALQVPLGKDDPALQLGHAIAARERCLIVLDNFEQVLEHAPATVKAWCDRAENATFVVTTRERLHVAGEDVLSLEPLPLAVDAVELFVVRARTHRPDVAIGGTDRRAIAELVRLLDGLPLAIELAAARVRVLSPEQLVERMRDRFGLLAAVAGARSRHATLRATIDWSWDLLAPFERSALAQCSVFAGGFRIEAAEGVIDLSACCEAPPIVDVIQALVDKSLVRVSVRDEDRRLGNSEPYFGMYASVHEYARERLELAGEQERRRLEERHGRYYARFGSVSAIDSLSSHGGSQRRRILATELDNLVAACRRAAARDDASTAIASYRAAWEVLLFRGPLRLGAKLGAEANAVDVQDVALRADGLVTWANASLRAGEVPAALTLFARAAELLADSGDHLRLGRLWNALGRACSECGKVDEARAHHEQALTAGERVEDRSIRATALGALGTIDLLQGQMEQARSRYTESIALHRQTGNRLSEAAVVGNLGLLHFEVGEIDDARRCHEESLAISREIGDRRGEGMTLGFLGILQFETGNPVAAKEYYTRSLVAHREVGSRRDEAVSLSNLGILAHAQGDLEQARADYESALSIAREAGSRRMEGLLLGDMGNLHRDLKQFGTAHEYYDKALVVHEEAGAKREEGVVNGDLARSWLAQGRADKARERVARAETLLRDVNNPIELAKVLCIQGHLEIQAGEPASARIALARAEAVASDLHVACGSELQRELDALRSALARLPSVAVPT